MNVLSVKQISKMHDDIVNQTGGSYGIRDCGMLEMSAKSAFQVFNDEYLYKDTISKVAMVAYSLVKNHPFVDGNKRIALHCMLVYLRLNGIEMKRHVKQQHLVALFEDLASSKIGFDDLKNWLYKNTFN